ncbi:MAG TPA: D-glycero-beta-D-manno-heptose 1-phosphate adenylyltransferase [Actinomycetota bacterium]|nr:D-glycero-beta-D-manno-heptose 1-phosphate adenylyltransferase [Actinomycetota bacterium]
MSRRLLVIGDCLLDRDLAGTVTRLAPDAPVPVVTEPVESMRPGGAGLAALLAARDGARVTFLTALSPDSGGNELRGMLAGEGIEVLDLGLAGPTPEKIRIRSDTGPLLRLDRGCGPGSQIGTRRCDLEKRFNESDAVLVSDYGRGMAAAGWIRDALAGRGRRLPVVWDPHPLGPDPVPGITLATPNTDEAARRVPEIAGKSLSAVVKRAQELVGRWGVRAVAVTLGRRGALLVDESGSPLAVPAEPVVSGDPCGAGDRFASAAALTLAGGGSVAEAVSEAVRSASQFVAAGGAGTACSPHARRQRGARPLDAFELARKVNAEGGTVVATGGCFDLLHAGHVSLLEQARALGDCLIVCLNSDASVRRLKGPNRPLVSEQDRRRVLEALSAVDAVAIFDQDTPVQLLEMLRPAIFAKGADYSVADLPEAKALARWGGQAVTLPYLKGRSTTALVREGMRLG